MKALITGVQGQDGWYLSELLLDLGYEVVGTRRSTEDPRLNPPGVRVVYGDVSDAYGTLELIEREEPDEIYNLAAITHVADSFSAQAVASAVNFNGACNVMAAAKRIGSKVYQASTSEMFGSTAPPQSETSEMCPRSPYAIAKLAAHWSAKNWRERGLFVSCGILFNHESPRRTPGFVTQKVAMGVADIVKGRAKKIVLGNLNAARDWGHAADYVRAMWLMLQHDQPDDFVVATGKMKTVAELCEAAFKVANLDWREFVESSDEFRRPLEVESLCGSSAKAADVLGWTPHIGFDDLVKEMVNAALKR